MNCKIELKLKWKKHNVLSAAGADNNDANSNNIAFTMKTQNYMSLLSLNEQKMVKSYQNFSDKDLKDQFILNEYKTKSENENTTNEYRYFSN